MLNFEKHFSIMHEYSWRDWDLNALNSLHQKSQIIKVLAIYRVVQKLLSALNVLLSYVMRQEF